MSAQFPAGDSAIPVWSWLLDPMGPCSYKHGAADSSLLNAIPPAPRLTEFDHLTRRSEGGRKEVRQSAEKQVEAGSP